MLYKIQLEGVLAAGLTSILMGPLSLFSGEAGLGAREFSVFVL